MCNSFGELVRIAKEWVADYGAMPLPVRRLFKHTHLHTACRLLGVSEVNLEYLSPSDTGTAVDKHAVIRHPDTDTATMNERGKVGLIGAEGSRSSGSGSSSGVGDLVNEAKRYGVGGDDDDGDGGGSDAINGSGGQRAGGSADDSNVDLGVENFRVASLPPPPAAAVSSGGGAAAAGTGDQAPVPFAMLRGPEVTKDRWEVSGGFWTSPCLRYVRAAAVECTWVSCLLGDCVCVCVCLCIGNEDG